MQRLSSLASLILFTVVLTCVAHSIQQDPSPLSIKGRGLHREMEQEDPGIKRGYLPERFDRPRRNGSELSGEAELIEEAKGEGPEEADLPEAAPWPEKTPGNEQAEEPGKEKETPFLASDFLSEKEGFHFLLVGRAWDYRTVDLLLVVTLVPRRHARLLSINPAFPLGAGSEGRPLIGKVLQEGGDYTDLCRAVQEVTGLAPRFYIDLNLEGFVEMVDMLGGIAQWFPPQRAEQVEGLEAGLNHLDGAAVRRLLTAPGLKAAEKETLITNLLVTARDVQNTRLGISLLWKGYHNIKTDLGLRELLEVRKVTQKISPRRVIFQEI